MCCTRTPSAASRIRHTDVVSDGVEGEAQRPTRRRPTERMQSRVESTPTASSRSRRARDPVRSKILYGGAVGLAAAALVAVGLAALFDVSFWAALGIAALIGLGLAMLLAVLVG